VGLKSLKSLNLTNVYPNNKNNNKNNNKKNNKVKSKPLELRSRVKRLVNRAKQRNYFRPEIGTYMWQKTVKNCFQIVINIDLCPSIVLYLQLWTFFC
jgi:hypothetical protein